MSRFKQWFARTVCLCLIAVQLLVSTGLAAGPVPVRRLPDSSSASQPAIVRDLSPQKDLPPPFQGPPPEEPLPGWMTEPLEVCTVNPMKSATLFRDDEILFDPGDFSPSFWAEPFAGTWRSVAGAPWTTLSTGNGDYSALAGNGGWIEVVSNHSGLLYHLRLKPDDPATANTPLNKDTEVQIVNNVSGFTGRPVFVARTSLELWAFSIKNDRRIYYNIYKNGGWASSWTVIPNVTNAVSGLSVVFRDPNHLDVVYKDAGNGVQFIEWAQGDWMDAAVGLGKQLAGDPTLFSMNANHLAVFGVEFEGSGLFVRQWTADKKIDWSDAGGWGTVYPSGAKLDKPTLFSLHGAHMGLIYRGTDNKGALFEYDGSSWSPLYLFNETFNSPLTALKMDDNKVMVIGTTAAGAKGWTRVTGQNWVMMDLNNGSLQSKPQLVTWAPGEVVLLGLRNGNELGADAYTSYRGDSNAPLSWQSYKNWTPKDGHASMDRAVLARVNKADGTPVSLLVWVGGDSRLYSRVGISNQTNPWLDVGFTGGVVMLAARDLDGNGSQEIIYANVNGAAVKLRVYSHSGDANATLNLLASTDYQLTAPSDPNYPRIAVAAGDLDGNGLDNEIVVVTIQSQWGRADIYRYTGQTLTKLNTINEIRTSTLSTGGVRSIAVVVDRIDQAYPSKDIIVIELRSAIASGSTLYAQNHLMAVALNADNSVVKLGIDTRIDAGARNPALDNSVADMVAADLDGDGFKEIVTSEEYGGGATLRVERFSNLTRSNLFSQDGLRLQSIAAGDLNGDGRDEIVGLFKSDGATSGKITVFRQKVGAPVGTLKLVMATNVAKSSNQLVVGDANNDALYLMADGCEDFRNVKPIVVLNAPPRWYPLQGAGVSYAKSSSYGTAAGSTTGYSNGGSLTVGFVVEANVPVLAVKAGEVRGSITEDFTIATTQSKENSQGETWTTTYGFDNGEGDTPSAGIVVYQATKYRCYYFRRPTEAAGTRSVSVCSHLGYGNTGKPQVAKASFAQWNSEPFKISAGVSWGPVGAPTNAMVGTDGYLSKNRIPITHFPLVKKFAQGEVMGADVFPSATGIEWDSSRDKTIGVEHSWEENTTVSAGATFGNLAVDASYTHGLNGSSSSSTTIGAGQTYGVQVYSFDPNQCAVAYGQACPDLVVVPYVYLRSVKTVGGDVYQVNELDYYTDLTASRDTPRTSGVASPQAAPQTPIIASTTHPNETTWYPTNTVTFNWAQPASDPAAILGYDWGLFSQPGNVPSAFNEELSYTATLTNVPEGLHYFSLRAKNVDGELSPVAERRVMVDTLPPSVTLTLAPNHPAHGWHNQPLNVTTTADDNFGSGVALVEYSLDGATWQAYTAPLAYTSPTPDVTVWARASDNLGHVSPPVSTTFKIDLDPPSSIDLDGYGLSYGRIDTNALGNTLLVLGGQLNDTGSVRSGQGSMHITGDQFGNLVSVDQVGTFPMPPGNVFTTSESTLGWIFTPTFTARGSYLLEGYGTDLAGNAEMLDEFGDFYWDPTGEPDYAQTRLTTDNYNAAPGEVVDFTLAIRNSGTQESSLIITGTLPAGLIVLPDTIDSNGHHVPEQNAIVWHLGTVWPGDTLYHTFRAQVDPNLTVNTPQNLTTQLLLHPYYPDDDNLYDDPPETSILGSVALVPTTGQNRPATPQVLFAKVADGTMVTDRDVRVYVHASKPVSFIYLREYRLSGLGQWQLAQESGWIPFETISSRLEATDLGMTIEGTLNWTLSEGDGVKMLEIRLTNAQQHLSSPNHGGLIYTNLFSANDQTLAAGETAHYRVDLQQDADLANWQLQVIGGNAEVYAWAPRQSQNPNYVGTSPAVKEGGTLSDLTFIIEEDGMYIVEVRATTNTTYRLVPEAATTTFAQNLSATQLPDGVDLSVLPAAPLTRTIPIESYILPELTWHLWFPVVMH